jgi:hypothetical protein
MIADLGQLISDRAGAGEPGATAAVASRPAGVGNRDARDPRRQHRI